MGHCPWLRPSEGLSCTPVNSAEVQLLLRNHRRGIGCACVYVFVHVYLRVCQICLAPDSTLLLIPCASVAVYPSCRPSDF